MDTLILNKEYYLAGQGDYFDRVSPGTLQNALQILATDHAEMVGAARESLSGRRVWVMTKSRLWMTQPIHRLKPVEASTWFRGHAGAQYIRDFDICQEGRRIGEAVTAWVILDLESGLIIRPGQSGLPEVQYTPPNPKTWLPGKLRRPEALVDAGQYTVRYSDLDMNRHMNNTRFTDLACDALLLWQHPHGFVQDVEIHYLGQCMPGETLALSKAELGDGRYYVTATGENNKRKFDAMLTIPTEAREQIADNR